MTPELTFLRPVDDPALVSGGNVYDRRVLAELGALGWDVTDLQLAGPWPVPDDDARARLDAAITRARGVVLVDGLIACGAPDVVVPHARRRPVAVLVHMPLGDDAEGRILRATTVLATSPWAARRIAARHGVDAAVAVPGTDPVPDPPSGPGGLGSVPDPSPPGPFGTRLLCLGALTPTKGQDLLVEALAELAHHPWTVELVGPTGRDPDFVTRLRETIRDHGLADRIRIPGPRHGVELDETWRATDLLVVPSRRETYGMVAAEALARGIPVVASDVGGLPETVGSGGVLVRAENVPALVAALHRWFAEPTHRVGLRISARSSACTLQGWTHTARRVSATLQGLLPVRPPATPRIPPPPMPPPTPTTRDPNPR